MSKRCGNSFVNSFISKKPKLDIVKTNNSAKNVSSSKEKVTKQMNEIDLDSLFEPCDPDLEEIDMISSQHSTDKVVKTKPDSLTMSNSSSKNFFQVEPSCSKNSSGNIPIRKKLQSKLTNNVKNSNEIAIHFTNNSSKSSYDLSAKNINGDLPSEFTQKFSDIRNRKNAFQPSQNLASSEFSKKFSEEIISVEEFKKDLIKNEGLNSTFHSNSHQNSEISDSKIQEFLKIKDKNKKLLDDMNQRDGENIYLRKQLEQLQSKIITLTNEKTLLIDNHNKQLNTELNIKKKEIEALKTQNDLSIFQIKQLTKSRKSVETKIVKLKAPQPISMSESPKQGSFKSTIIKEISFISTQTEIISKNPFHLNKNIYYPFKNIPTSIFNSPYSIKPIIDFEISDSFDFNSISIEKLCKSDEKINKKILKPTTTIINNKPLNVSFVQLEIGDLRNVLKTELNFNSTIFIINKIVITTQELLLNTLNDLQILFNKINNDDIRVMNNIYFSSFYDNTSMHTHSSCDSDEWHDKERSIDARRLLEILSIIAEKSVYLCNYITKKKQLNTMDDASYDIYIKKMTRYNLWGKKGHDYEFLELILDTTKMINANKRSHQFTGLICSITRLLANVQRNVGFTNTGLNYVTLIFKELVFSRPMLKALISITEMMSEFKKLEIFINFIINNQNKHAVIFFKNRLYFSKDACTIDILTRQLIRFYYDDITTVQLTYALMSFIDVAFRSGLIPWSGESNKYSAEFIKSLINNLRKCVQIDLNNTKKKFINNHKLNDYFWQLIRRKQIYTLKAGLRFLTYITKLDPEFLVMSDIQTSFILFIKHISLINLSQLYLVKDEALTIIESSFLNKYISTCGKSHDSQQLSNIEGRLARMRLTTSKINKLNQNNCTSEDEIINKFELSLEL